MPTDSLKKRYFAKVSTNVFGAALGLVTQALIARGLGPVVYGDFQFLSNFFSRIVAFWELGTSIGFYTKLSKRQDDFGLVSFYLSFAGVVAVVLITLTGCAYVANIYSVLLPGQTTFFIFLAAFWGILTWGSQILDKMADAFGLTVPAEIARILQKGLGLIVILALYLTNRLNLTNFFFYHYFILIFLAVVFIGVMGRNGHSLRRSWKLSTSKIKAYAKEFYDYSHPLFLFGSVGLIVGLVDRWMLQKFGGSVEQGFFGLSYKISVLCFLATGSMTMLITREFSIAFEKKDIKGMAKLFRRYIPMLSAVSAYFACFVAVEANKVILILGGVQFEHAAVPVMIMAFFPIHQSYGQLSGSVFYATGQTKLYRNIGVTFMILGLPIGFFLLAPINMMGLNAGAIGLAIKTVVLNIILVNVQLYFNSRFLNLRFWRYIGHQVICVGSLLGCAYAATFGVKYFVGLHDEIVLSFLLSGLLYTILVVGVAYFQPIIVGLKREDIRLVTRFIMRKN